MINILKSGKDKVFVEKCPYCATEFEYQLEDVTFRKDKADGSISSPRITCPVCKFPLDVFMWTKEDRENLSNVTAPYVPCRIGITPGEWSEEVKIV